MYDGIALNTLDKAGNYLNIGDGIVLVLLGRRILDRKPGGFRARHEARLSRPSRKKGIKLLSPSSTQLYNYISE